LRDRVEVRSQGLRDNVIEVPVDPLLQRRDLLLDDLDGHRLLLGIAPVDVEPGFDAWRQEQWDAGLSADVLRVALSDLGHDAYDAARCVTEQVDRVLNPPGPG